jgi:hypothetical protein
LEFFRFGPKDGKGQPTPPDGADLLSVHMEVTLVKLKQKN